MEKYNVVKFITMDQVLLQHRNAYFVASFADVPHSGPEVLVFPSDSEGKITDWIEVDGGRGYESLADFITTGGLKVQRFFNDITEDSQ